MIFPGDQQTRPDHSWTWRRVRSGLASAALFAAIFVVPAASANGNSRADTHWVATWGASPQSAIEAFLGPAPEVIVLENQTVRMVARISLGGDSVRVRLDNSFGNSPLVIGAATIGVHEGGALTQGDSIHNLTFGGSPGITIPVGAPVLSDPVELRVPDLSELAISLYLPQSTEVTSEHSLGLQTAYLASGDVTDSSSFPTEFTAETRYFLSGIEVQAHRNAMAIVTIGDSITDGFASTPDTNSRWPDVLAERLLEDGNGRDGRRHGMRRTRSVVNSGISGNRVLNSVIGPNALSRFDRDVLAQPGAGFVTVLEGINDIGFTAFVPDQDVTAERIIQGYRQMIVRAHSQCLKIIGATLTPFGGALYFTPEGEAKRQAVNDFIRNSGEFDAVIDFDAATRDPANPEQFLSLYDSGDMLHPSDAGYEAMANAIDLGIFRKGLVHCQ